jgi:hypothetical protein
MTKRTKVLIVAALVGVLSVIMLLANYSFLEIRINDTSTHEGYSLEFLTPAGKSLSEQTNQKTVKKLLRRNSYQIEISSSTGSFFTHVKTGGFLSTSRIEAELIPENSRVFVGDNPLPCMSYSIGLLFSWECLNDVSRGVVHQPATEQLASAHKRLDVFGYSGLIMEDLVQKTDSAYILARLDFDGPGSIDFYKISQAGVVDGSSPIKIAGTDIASVYGVMNHENSYAIYSHQGDSILLLDDIGATPTQIKPSDHNKEGLTLYSFGSYGKDMLLVYTAKTTNELSKASYFPSFPANDDLRHSSEGFVEQEEDESGGILILTNKQGGGRVIEFDFGITQARLCDTNLLCVLHNGELDLYDISGAKPLKQHSLVGIEQIEMLGNDLIAINQKGVLKLNASGLTGYYAYIFGDYTYCGMRVTNSDFLLCISNAAASTRKRSVLKIDINSTETDFIDKKLLQLAQLDSIDQLSIYGNIIHVSPDYGQLEFSQDSGEYEYNPLTMKRAKSDIDRLTASLDLSPAYRIVYPFND